METDVVIIGGGVTGTAIARELARYALDITLIEKADDVAMGTSKANSGIIHAGYNADASTLKGKLNANGNPMFDKLCEDLNVSFKRIGSLVVGFTDEDLEILKVEKANGEKNGIKGLEIVSGDKLFEMEPNLNPEAKYALFAPTAGIISPYELTIALANNAVLNGVKVLLETEVTDIEIENGEIKTVITNKGLIKTKIVINAAGLFADKIAEMVGENFKIRPRKGEYHLFDKQWGSLVNHVLFPIPTKLSKGILVTPTAHGNLLIGPNSQYVDEKDDLAITKEGLNEIVEGAKKLVPNIPHKDLVTSFAGLRADGGSDFIIGVSKKVKGFINAAAIQSPGLSSAPAIAEMIVDIVKDIANEISDTFEIKYKDKFIETLPEQPRFVDYLDKLDEWQKIIEKDPNYGEIICRCERVTKGEIINAIHSLIPARSLDAIKRRTRAGMGRCQGGFCGPRVLEILSEELSISSLNVTKKGKGSEVLKANSKEMINKAGDKDEVTI